MADAVATPLTGAAVYAPPAAQRPGPDAEEAEPCVTCGLPAGTPYCPHCGERRAADRPLRLWALAGEAWDEFAALDGRVARSLWALVRRPGALTAAYVRGERLRYLTPLKLFLLVNVLYFLHATATGQNTFTTPLQVHLTATSHAPLARRFVDARLAERRVREADYAKKFDPVAAAQAKSLVIALVPLYAACVAAVARGRGRPAIQHAAFAFHAVAVLLLGLMAVAYAAVGAATVVARLAHTRVTLTDNFMSSVIALVLWAWLAPALRRAYGGSWALAAVRGLALTWCVLPVLYAYRLVLFFTTFWAT